MAASDQLFKLAERAKEAEDRVAAAKGKAKGDLEQEANDARAVAQAQADDLRETIDSGKGKVSDWWADAQRSWSEHVATIHSNIERRHAEHDRERAEENAEIAEDDAMLAIDYAEATIEEAEYAALDAALARAEADELAAASS
jgi:hypothetical protein